MPRPGNSGAEQIAGQPGRLGQGDQVAAGQHVRLDAEPLPRQRCPAGPSVGPG
ncbi:MAG TPA: hypothetical protein VGF54_22460 [Streptosporangiaceae bacterium]